VCPLLLASIVIACVCMLLRLHRALTSNQNPRRWGHPTLSRRRKGHRHRQGLRWHERGLGGGDRRRQGGGRWLVKE